MQKNNKSILRNNALQTILISLICIVIGLAIGFIVLSVINPSGAWKALTDILKNYMNSPRANKQLKDLGNTLVKTAPLLMCSLSVLFAYKVGLFNIGAAGQYVVGACVSLYCALGFGMPWYACLIMAAIAGALWGTISGALKAFCNVNEVISCIMLNWIALYCTNMLLSTVKESTSPYTLYLKNVTPSALLPTLGLGEFFGDNKYVTIALPLAVIIAIVIWILLEHTRLGYELKATGNNKNAAKYCGMNEKFNIILTMAISGALAALGAAFFFLSGYERWECTCSSVPAMGFNGIAAAFLGGLNPIGTIFSSYFIQHITSGGSYVDTKLYCSQISDLISSIIIYLCGFVLCFRGFFGRIVDKLESKYTKAAINSFCCFILFVIIRSVFGAASVIDVITYIVCYILYLILLNRIENKSDNSDDQLSKEVTK